NENQRAYWESSENRKRQSEKVATYFQKHPERKEWLQEIAEKEWSNSDLLAWRSEKTKTQWTPEFRAQRKETYNQTYLRKALRVLHEVWIESGSVSESRYDAIRKERRDRSLIKLDTIASRFFENDRKKLEEAVANYNHRIKTIVSLSTKVDVYDIEVPKTHNFALASGVFVHNSSKQGRDRRTQAVLPLKGKILNVERARLDKILGFAEIKALVIAMGTGIAESFDVSKLRYHKIIIATDADVDGAHIRTLLLTLFYRYFKALLEGGYIYIAQPPLYKIKRGKEIHYFYSEQEKNAYLKKEGIELKEAEEESRDENREASEEEEGEAKQDGESADTKKLKSQPAKKLTVSIQRYKGLGEMNPEELWETTMDPARRILKQVSIGDAQEADKVFDILMGEDVPSRKSFIQSNATKATLDI
ncbi:MAG: toprim domain-containing protein, partial [bacterium]|nr:toprim domain-containing protein [bacterium]